MFVCHGDYLSPLLFPLFSPPVPLDIRVGEPSLAPLPPCTHSPAPVVDPSLSQLGPVAGLWVAIVTVAKSLRLIASDGAVGSIHAGG